MLLALAIVAAAVTSPTPPPTIITIKASPLCSVVRTVVAPTIAGLLAQDGLLDSGQTLLRTMADDQANGSDVRVELDDVRLLNVVDRLAANDIKVHQLIEKIDASSVHDEKQAAAVAALRARLLTIADRQNSMMNSISESVLSYDANQMNSAGNAIANSIEPLKGDSTAAPLKAIDTQEQAFRDLMGDSDLAASAAEVAKERRVNETPESRIASDLAPLIARCS